MAKITYSVQKKIRWYLYSCKETITVGDEINYYTEVTGGDLKAGDYIIMDYSISEGDTFQGERGSDVTETEDGGSTGMSFRSNCGLIMEVFIHVK